MSSTTSAPLSFHSLCVTAERKSMQFVSVCYKVISCSVSLGGLGLTCSPRDPRFAGSNPAKVDGFFQNVKILSRSPLGGTLSRGS